MLNKLALGAVVGFGLLAPPTAEALPLLSHRSFVAPSSVVENVKIICNEEGRCYRPPTRRPVARWVYGDNNFYGPYAGPGYYGNPRFRYNWWPFWW
jgi:hypothetical protein